ncbi:hypothetical protein [Xanthocytophaga agilis]|uniref:Uncharacterized protein n=1 Tax=Xanthocytophaga agilis TaxID=3048010 RepID=A0AAE3R101_9BACT|nr:hypothetical protein [Xanthocytophaga agilis]MDJ1499450.1 hypothetical protein [Xanthocytophaga agilis]
MHKQIEYTFVGDTELLRLVKSEWKGYCITSVADIEYWIKKTYQKPDTNSEITATFIIDLEYNLVIHDRHSEHVVCAAGENVLSAGEITFVLLKNKTYFISQITNQSTGYCPSPKSWDMVKCALEKIRIPFPDFFTTAFEFRICGSCGWINVIKDNYFVCINNECQNQLPPNEN